MFVLLTETTKEDKWKPSLWRAQMNISTDTAYHVHWLSNMIVIVTAFAICIKNVRNKIDIS